MKIIENLFSIYFYQNHTVPKAYNIYAFSDTLSIDFFLHYFQGNNYDSGSIIRTCCWNIYVFILAAVLK